MEVIGRLAGGVAHDFNNLLTVILGNASLLSETNPHPRLRQIEQAAEMGAALTRKLLTFSRKTVIQPQPLNLSWVIRDLGSLLERLIGEDVRIQYQLETELPLVRADITQMEQILLNLAANSRDAMPRGGELTLKTSDEDREVLLEVTDNGIGMDEALVKRIFEPFFTTKETGQGTGLGLSTVREIVAQIGGIISVASAPGKGATFSLRFPIDHTDIREASRVIRKLVGHS
jgi:signal transduction histidine kinase